MRLDFQIPINILASNNIYFQQNPIFVILMEYNINLISPICSIRKKNILFSTNLKENILKIYFLSHIFRFACNHLFPVIFTIHLENIKLSSP